MKRHLGQRAGIMVTLAIALPMLLAFVGLSIDVGNYMLQARFLIIHIAEVHGKAREDEQERQHDGRQDQKRALLLTVQPSAEVFLFHKTHPFFSDHKSYGGKSLHLNYRYFLFYIL